MFVLPLPRSTQRAGLYRDAAPQFHRLVDRLFDASQERRVDAAPGDPQTRTPPVDVSETNVDYTVVFEVPGVTREQLKVSVEGRRVQIETADAVETPTGTQRQEATSRAIYRERGSTHYARTVVLPSEVDQAASQAKFENGLLVLTLGKKIAAGATRLNIN